MRLFLSLFVLMTSMLCSELQAVSGYQQQTYDALVANPATEHVKYFSALFELKKDPTLLEFGINEGTKFFLDNCKSVTSIELITTLSEERHVKRVQGHLNDFAMSPNWTPDIHKCDTAISRAELVALRGINPATIDCSYLNEFNTLCNDIFRDKKYDIVFVNPGIFLRGDLVNELFDRSDIIVALDMNYSSVVYGWSWIKKPSNYERFDFPAGKGTTIWVKSNQTDIINGLKNFKAQDTSGNNTKSTTTSKRLKLNRVIIATNNNPIYIELWPVVAPLWAEAGFRPTLALIADENCPIDTTLGDVIRFPPIPGVTEALYSQAIRLLLPALYPDDGCLLADIDILPISRSYLFDGTKECPEQSFLVYRDQGCFDKNQYAMCYVAAKGSVFGSIFGVSSKDDIPDIIKKWSNLGYGWETDQIMLCKMVKEWEAKGNHVKRLGHVVGPRLDRAYWAYQMQNLDVSKYIDCHCPRPYSEHKESIDRVSLAIRDLWKREGKIEP